MERDWAIIVGVKDYLDPGLNTLQGPVNDARSFYNWLVRPDGGNIFNPAEPVDGNPARIKLVTSNGRPVSPAKAKPTADDVYVAGQEIMHWLESHRETGRRLYVYMAGHGCRPISPEQDESVGLLMANARTSDAMLSFPATACARYMRRGGYFEEVILIMDCCRSEERNAVTMPYYQFLGDTTKKGILVEAYATSRDSQAHEFPYPPSKDKRGAFTRALITCLESGKLTGYQLKSSLEVLVYRDLLAQGLSERAASERKPDVRSDSSTELSQVWFSEGAPPARTEISIKRVPGMPDPQIFRSAVWPEELVHKESGEDPDPWHWRLEPGTYGLRIGEFSRKFDVYAGSPEEL